MLIWKNILGRTKQRFALLLTFIIYMREKALQIILGNEFDWSVTSPKLTDKEQDKAAFP